MDDLTQKLNDLLSSPDSMQKIQDAMAALGVSGGEAEDTETEQEEESSGGLSLDSGTISSLLSALTGGNASEPALAPAKKKPRGGNPTVKLAKKEDSGGMPDLSILMKLAPLMTSLNRDDEDTILLKALRPYLHGDREKRLDDAIKIMRFIKFIPLLQDRGLF